MDTSPISSSSEESNNSSSSTDESTEGTGCRLEDTLAGCEGTQRYMFEPYDSEASSGISNSSKESTPEDEIPCSDWYVHLR